MRFLKNTQPILDFYIKSIKPHVGMSLQGLGIVLLLAIALNFISIQFAHAGAAYLQNTPYTIDSDLLRSDDPIGIQSDGIYSRIKEITHWLGDRTNSLTGYGLIVGLNGTGDKNSSFTNASFANLLEIHGADSSNRNFDSKNIAAVMVTAQLPAFSKPGSRIDISISSIGNATSLEGGQLLPTQLLGPDRNVYAVGEGNINTGSISAKGEAASVTKGIPTNGAISNGAIVERMSQNFDLNRQETLNLLLHNPDLTTARMIADTINKYTKQASAFAQDSNTVLIRVPPNRPSTVNFMTEIEQLQVQSDSKATIVVKESEGIVVIGHKVKIKPVAIAHGNLTIRITELPQVSQPNPESSGETTVVPRTDIDIDKSEEKQIGIVSSGVALQDLVNNLNAMGVSPRDLIGILQAIKAAGALQAEIKVI